MALAILRSLAAPRTARNLLCVTAAVALVACGGGGGAKKSAGGSAPAFDECVTAAAAEATTQLALADVVDGGMLYDKWYAVLIPDTPPQDTIPLWEQRAVDAKNTSTGAATWRCKECHGWDYAGANGAYNINSSKYTGFPGVLAAQVAQPAEVFCAIKVGTADAPSHNFGAQPEFSDVHVWNLTKFILEGAEDTSTYIASNKGVFGADATRGQRTFQDAGCGGRSCHGPTGELNVGDEGLGGLAVDNPWEFMHKLRFGDPGDRGQTSMPAFEYDQFAPLNRTEILDVIAYAQSTTSGLKGATGVITPIGGGSSGGGSSGGGSSGGGSSGGGSSGGAPGNAFTSGKNLGGRLYDNHFAEVNRPATVDNPMWALRLANQAGVRNSRTGRDTWRCKECHGWDYKGKDGVYGQAPGGAFYDPVTKTDTHYTGFPGVFGSRFTSVDAVFSYLKFGIQVPINGVSTLVHAFGVNTSGQPFIAGSPALTDDQVRALAEFVVNGGVIDTDAYILNGLGQKSAIGDPVRGQALYTAAATSPSGQCSTCHNADGKKIDFDSDPAAVEYVGTLAVDNPWETLHKIRFGDPGFEMPSALQNGLTDQDSRDMLRFSQTLPTR